jgi:imidazole glycerol-phosphate synthase subunit HisH
MGAGDRASGSSDVLTVVDLGVSNLGSLTSALRFLGAEFEVTDETEAVEAAAALILPGVGAFDAAVERMDTLRLRAPIVSRFAAGVPILGVCLGMQLLLDISDEGEAMGLGVFPGRVQRLGLQAKTKVPHVGFDVVQYEAGSWASKTLGPSAPYYFTHSFAVRELASDVSVGTCGYDGGFVAALERWPVVGAQFHPEKSQTAGLRFLLAFLERWRADG